MAKFYYAVREGRKPGIYKTWGECEKQVKGYGGAIYKKFKKEADALKFINGSGSVESKSSSSVESKCSGSIESKSSNTSISDTKELDENKGVFIFVDGSYNAETKEAGWGYVVIKDGEFVEESFGTLSPDRIDTSQRNVLGEMFGALFAEKYAKDNNIESITIGYDYRGLRDWVTGDFKANNTITQTYRDIMQNSPIEISFKKIEAHTGHKWNERADVLAKKGAHVA